MAEYIIKILRSNLMVVFSWGFHGAVAIDNGLRFLVNGFKHKGAVEVIYNEGLDLFSVRTLNSDGKVKEETNGVYLDCLVNVIDGMVERTEDYEKRVSTEYGL